uniref:DUF4604 domain-containing protein n=1 Tax=Panagrellus redivivus TaxID=6233 RepID=A0A7E4WCS8_PANRE
MLGCVFPWTVLQLVIIAILFSACSKKKPQNRRPPPGASARSARSGASAQNGSRSGSAQPNSNMRSAPSRSSAQKSGRPDSKEKYKGKKRISSQMKTPESKSGIPDDDYGEVAEPTTSAKKRREAELEREKRDKIKKGFYQENSDEDDTLEPIKSLKQEQTEESTKKSSKKRRR